MALTLPEKCKPLTAITPFNAEKLPAKVTEEAGAKGKRFRDLSGKSRSLAAGSPERLSMEKQIEAVLDWFRTAPDSEVVTVKIVE